MQYEAFLKATYRFLTAGLGMDVLVLGYGRWGLVFALLVGSLVSVIVELGENYERYKLSQTKEKAGHLYNNFITLGATPGDRNW